MSEGVKPLYHQININYDLYSKILNESEKYYESNLEEY